MKNKVIGDNLTKSEAKKLAAWWNAFSSTEYYFVRKMDNGKYFEVYKQ